MPELALPDVNLHFEMDGDGPPLLLLAGMLSDSASWAPLLPALAAHFTVIRPDNRTTGRTVPWDAPVSVSTCASDAAKLMAHLGHERFHVAGHSMGGLIAMELVGQHPDHILSLSVLASAPVRAPRTMAIFDTLRDIRKCPEGETLWLRALYPWIFAPEFFADPNAAETALQAALDYPYAQGHAAMSHQIEMLRAFRPSVRLPDISARSMALHGEHDILVPRVAAQAAFTTMPDIIQHVVKGAGHSIHWDAPDAVSDHLIAFCL